ncbi:beta-lactamase family protein [Pseudoalteromonas sp. SCSIO 43201]|uniref:serine hydrolase domain-containing protein n=1 Tax=Pseudoalteromonas sp. SCSIO 43201 TaxID=2822842 RepID=UPI002075A7B3|nr:serine hydrolase domain-containing protein [Pseudoalteromonas sp. SCSIO 43201]USD27875.1 beta-lactamase family protein [Pseudoalteromonas sp. SCSIO 43201]
MFSHQSRRVPAWFCAILCVLLFSACNNNDKSIITLKTPTEPSVGFTSPYGVAGDDQLFHQLELIRAEFSMPALGGFIISGDELIELDVTGVRSSTGQVPVSAFDRWSIGSFSKSMTATLAARLVEQGVIEFDSQVADIFPELIGKINPELESVTLNSLLSMTSGLQRDLASMYSGKWHRDNRDMTSQRYDWTIELLNAQRSVPQGTYLYSNAGYVVAGHMLERVTGQAWESLIAQELFEPLGMADVGFGSASDDDPDGQPSGHQMREGKWHPITPTDRVDLPKVIGPAGLINTTLHDLSIYLGAYLAGARGNDNLISASSYARLLTPVTPEYGLGWILTSNDSRFHHNGFTGTFYLDNLVLPERNVAILAVTNGDTVNAKLAVEKVIDILLKRLDAKQHYSGK